ncbi:type II secretion system minor pseudopilin [Mariniblastus fucicola]|uniref:General secretion pathway protein K n=1 Tax=Mariniblastus fucicola TaxID=980251 RepID=A0A5B9P801_9BACT|nr:type II secretion system protein GspK [Mariniblastus fucicola]QEG22444.1 General secretion pathway protein K [Mariniblastus fucicola]
MTSSHRFKSIRRNDRGGSILLIVLVTVAILALSVLSFSSLMLVEEQAARVMTRRIQSKYLVESGMEYTRMFLARPESEIVESGGLWNNEDTFRGVAAVADINNPGRNSSIGRFTLVAPGLNDDGIPEGTRNGVVNESSKININVLPYYDYYDALSEEEPTIARGILMGLPDMEEEIADAILDFIDLDDEERENGTESSYYRGLSPAYQAKNGPLDSIDELLLVRGVTPELLFGLDTNRNGVLDESEASLGDVSLTEAETMLGWANYLTLYSKESNLTAEGIQKININADDLDQLYDDLKSVFNDDWANFIIMVRLGTYEEGVPDDPEEANFVTASQISFEIPETTEPDELNKFRTVIDFMDIVYKTQDDDGNEVYVESPLNSSPGDPSLVIAMQSLTVYEGLAVPGRINIRQASRAVLSGIPVIADDDELLGNIISYREIELDDPDFLDKNRKYETFLLAEGLVDQETMKLLMPYICAGGDVYRAEIVGYFGDGRGTSRAEAVFDTTSPVPQILMWRDKSHLQTGYSIEALGSELQAVGSQLDR